jgi:hypothetical protein
MGIILGITSQRSKLHALASVSNPSKPLYLQKREWDALLATKRSSVELLDWKCGDHASERETTVRLTITGKGIQAIRRTFDCTVDGKRGRLLRGEAF